MSRTLAPVRQVAVEVLLVTAGVVVYFGTRGLTAGGHDTAVANAHDVLAVERALGLELEHWFQALVLDSDVRSTLMNWIYIWGHWPVVIATLLWLAFRHRTIYLRLRNGMFVSGGLGLGIYASYPVAPPRLADLGLVDTVLERSTSYRVLQPPAFTNQYAAMPSLHVGWNLLVGMALFAAATWAWLRVIGVLMPLLMALATVTTANHYVLDVLAGAALALVGHAVALWIERRRAGPEQAPPGTGPPRAAHPPDTPSVVRPPETPPAPPSRVTPPAPRSPGVRGSPCSKR